MNPWSRIALIGAAAVVAFDTLASFAARSAGIPYVWASLGSLFLYAAVGYLAARTSLNRQVRAAALAGLAVGLTDATVGWFVSWVIGPGRVAGGMTVAQWVFTAAFVALISSGLAALGGIAGRLNRGASHRAV